MVVMEATLTGFEGVWKYCVYEASRAAFLFLDVFLTASADQPMVAA